MVTDQKTPMTATNVKELINRSGGWGVVLRNIGGPFNEAIDKADRAGGKYPPSVPCPKQPVAGSTRYRLFDNWEENGGAYHNDAGPLHDGFNNIQYVMNQDFKGALQTVVDACGGNLDSIPSNLPKAAPKPARPRLDPQVAETNRRVAEKVYSGVQPLIGSPAESYLRTRGIKGDLSGLKNLFYHPALVTYVENEKVTLPGMVAFMDNLGKPVTLHRTFLDPQDQSQKATRIVGKETKRCMSPMMDMRGSKIHLDDPVEVQPGKFLIGVAEGIETCLAVREASGCPMWAGYSDRIMEVINFPDNIKYVVIWEDKDPSEAGSKAGHKLKERLEKLGLEVLSRKIESDKPKMDWLDVYNELGTSGFPQTLKPEYQLKVLGGAK